MACWIRVSSAAPTPNDHDATRAFYDRISRVYDLLADATEQEARVTGLDLLAVKQGERVLEIGFGTGHALVRLAREVGEQSTVAGIDLSPGMHAVARERLAAAGLSDRVDLRCNAVPPLPFGDATFDAAFMSFTLESFADETIPLVLAEVRRVLRQGGRVGLVALSAPPPGAQNHLLERAYHWLHRHFPHVIDCRPIDVGEALRAAGLRITRHTGLEIWTLRVAAVVAMVPRSEGGAG